MGTKANGTAGTGDVIDADQDPDGVSAALGLEDAPDQDVQNPDDADTGDDGDDDEDELTLESLAAELRELKRDNARLKREAAQARVKAKAETSKGTATDSGDGDAKGETVEQAAARGREEARAEYGLELAEASVRSVLIGIIPESDLDDFVDDLRIERYVGDDGKPDRDAIKALKDRQAKITRRKAPARVGHGRRDDAPVSKSKGELMGETLTSLGL